MGKGYHFLGHLEIPLITVLSLGILYMNLYLQLLLGGG